MKKSLFTFLFLVMLGGLISAQNHLQLFNDFHTCFAKRDWKKLEAMLSYDFERKNGG
jgi:hypothetical protein